MKYFCRFVFLLYVFGFAEASDIQYAKRPCSQKYEGKLCVNEEIFNFVQPNIELGKTTFTELKKQYGETNVYISKVNRYRKICYLFVDGTNYVMVEFGSWDITKEYRVHNIHISKIKATDKNCNCRKLNMTFRFVTKAGLTFGLGKQEFFRITKLINKNKGKSEIKFTGGLLDEDNNIFINQIVSARFEKGRMVDLFLEKKTEPFM